MGGVISYSQEHFLLLKDNNIVSDFLKYYQKIGFGLYYF
jgi:hypothetical protein